MSLSTARKTASVYGDDAIDDGAIARAAVMQIKGTGSDFIDGVISGVAWKGGKVTYAFTDSPKDYSYGPQPKHGYGEVSTKIKAAAEFALDTSYGSKANDGFAVEGFTKLHISQGSDTNSMIRYGESSYKNPTAYAYYPNQQENGGDVWIGPSLKHYSNAVQGNYEFATILHETGHALGLKHGHEANNHFPAIPKQWDSLEYSIMTYRSFAGDDGTGYKNESFGFPQTYMMADIAALQHMYGANFNVNSGNTVYSWKPNSGNTYVNGEIALHPGANRIFATIWDGGGKDTYDLSAYSNSVYVDLRPGGASQFKASQLADLDQFSNNPKHIAQANIYNALQYKGDNRSLIEDAIGGSGNDVIWGNQGGNHLFGSGGADSLSGWGGNDTLVGGAGGDHFVFKKNWGHDTVVDFGQGDKIDLRSYNFNSLTQLSGNMSSSHGDVVIALGNGDTLTIEHVAKGDLGAGDFLL